MRRRGFSLLEMIIVTGVVASLSAAAVPKMLSSLDSLKLSAAATSVQGAIQSTRYLAIMRGYPYQLALTAGTTSYQIGNKPAGSSSFSNVGGAVPFTGLQQMTVTSNTLQFMPNGGVTATTGAMSFSLAYKGATRTIGVSANGDVSVTNP
jgi:prepilin-type N-terminal cleavage/methylation domain-containing protein